MVSNLNINNILAKFSGQASDRVLSAIQGASDKTGVDFAYLVQQAKVESSFNPTAKAKSSSASGLYQFINSTWLSTVEKHGEKYGIDTDGMSRQQLLNLRNDPEIASNMAAEFALENKQFLDSTWGGDVGSTELYLAHFMGAGGAASFLKAKDENPLMAAADVFPTAAKANRAVFYDSKTGKPRSFAEVYDFFDQKFQIGGDNSAGTQVASVDEKISSSIFQNRKKSFPVLEENSYESVLFAQLNNRGITNPFGDTTSGSTSSLFTNMTHETRTMPSLALMQNPVSLMMLAEQDMPYEKASNEQSWTGRQKSNDDKRGSGKDLSI